MNQLNNYINDNFNEYDAVRFIQDVYAFNELSGQASKLDKSAIYNQLKLIAEETDELHEAVETNNAVEALDACIDIMYVLAGMMQKLEAMGMDVVGAMQQVANDNLTKFPGSKEVAELTQDMYNKQGIETTVTYSDKFNRWVIKDTNAKVRKPIGFTSTDLTKYVPKKLQGGF